MATVHFTGIRLRNYKAFDDFQLSLNEFNVLVGANNAGKSTIISAFRILSEGIRRAQSRKADPIDHDRLAGWAYPISLKELPIAGENVFFNYDDSTIAEVRFRLSNDNSLKLVFPEARQCFMVCETPGKPIRTPTEFRKAFPVELGFVPILGPVEHEEKLYQRDAARLALLTHRASRNFRNIWYHFGDDFEEFRALVIQTWPGMDIQAPESQFESNEMLLRMFCPEERLPREIYWAGYGFQVWCQMLTFIVKAKKATMLVIDEPDIYLHSDLQRQLVQLLRELGPDVLIATHSTEMISEVEPDELVIVNKKNKAGRRIKNPGQLQGVFATLGSNLNPTLTQLAKTRRAIFVEGKDFQIIGGFARKLGKEKIATRADFAVIPVEGYNPQRISELSKGIELTLGAKILKGAIFDRDYRSNEAVKEAFSELSKLVDLPFIHQRKELENYLLVAAPLQKAIDRRLRERTKRVGSAVKIKENIEQILDQVTSPLKTSVGGQYVAKYAQFEMIRRKGVDPATVAAEAMELFEKGWQKLETRLNLVPGKEVLSLLNQHLQTKYQISVTPLQVVGEFEQGEIPKEVLALIRRIDDLTKKVPPD
jgi:energy-coupling factor transporter ATP-binding protein EcfA2